MDCTTWWAVEGGEAALLAAVGACIEGLVDVAKQKHNVRRPATLACDAYAQGKVLELLMLVDGLTSASPSRPERGDGAPGAKSDPSRLVGTHPCFGLNELYTMGDDVRVVLVADVGDDVPQSFHGTVKITGPRKG